MTALDVLALVWALIAALAAIVVGLYVADTARRYVPTGAKLDRVALYVAGTLIVVTGVAGAAAAIGMLVAGT